MELETLKGEVALTWDMVCQIQKRDNDRAEWMAKDDITDSEGLRQTVAQHGDLNARLTWENAFIALHSTLLSFEDEPGALIESWICDRFSQPEWKPLLRPLLCHLMQTPNGCELLEDGLNAIREDGWLFSDSPSPDTLSIIQEMLEDGTKRERLEKAYR